MTTATLTIRLALYGYADDDLAALGEEIRDNGSGIDALRVALDWLTETRQEPTNIGDDARAQRAAQAAEKWRAMSCYNRRLVEPEGNIILDVLAPVYETPRRRPAAVVAQPEERQPEDNNPSDL